MIDIDFDRMLSAKANSKDKTKDREPREDTVQEKKASSARLKRFLDVRRKRRAIPARFK